MSGMLDTGSTAAFYFCSTCSCTPCMCPPPKTPFTCPVCHGAGTVSKPPWVAGDQEFWADASGELYDCPACGKTGVVWG